MAYREVAMWEILAVLWRVGRGPQSSSSSLTSCPWRAALNVVTLVLIAEVHPKCIEQAEPARLDEPRPDRQSTHSLAG